MGKKKFFDFVLGNPPYQKILSQTAHENPLFMINSWMRQMKLVIKLY